MNVLIIEDEKIAARKLENMLHQIDESIIVLGRIGTIRDAIDWLGKHTADLIFCDIHLSDGLSFNIFDKTAIKTPVIFTTAYDQYAIKAFKVNSIDYLLKPVEPDKLRQSIEKFKSLTAPGNIDNMNVEALLKEFVKREEGYKKRFMVTVGSKVKIINVEDISYFFIENKNVFIKTLTNKMVAIDFSLDAMEKMLDPDLFFRINRKYIVHINAIENLHILSKSRIKVALSPQADEDIIISFNRSRNFKKWLNK
jgi:two-component system, LytTR family, response regulator LytT